MRNFKFYVFFVVVVVLLFKLNAVRYRFDAEGTSSNSWVQIICHTCPSSSSDT